MTALDHAVIGGVFCGAAYLMIAGAFFATFDLGDSSDEEGLAIFACTIAWPITLPFVAGMRIVRRARQRHHDRLPRARTIE